MTNQSSKDGNISARKLRDLFLKSEKKASQKHKLEEQHEALLKEALSRPGVAEYMKAYEECQEVYRVFDSYRSATRRITEVDTTDHANIDHLPR